MAVLTSVRNDETWKVKKVILVGTGAGAPVAAVTAALMLDRVDALALETGGFRLRR
ncbi:MAG: hypothetical protein HC779_06290 [Phyllobacteriaceae bacterium]|nr:hypothetical protein [Phyllobacteriaceae bacterium]